MTITVEIKPEVGAELSRQAASSGVGIEHYVVRLLEQAATAPEGLKKLSQSQLDRMLSELSQFSGKIPLLPDEAFSREELYDGHD